MATPTVHRSRARATVAGFVLAAAVAAACSTGNALEGAAPTVSGTPFTPPATSTGGTVAAPPLEAPVTEAGFDYEWQRLPIGAGGWVTGLVIHAGSGTMYARTDVGGAYRYDAAARTWHQMLTATSVPSPDPAHDEYAVESIAVSPADPNVVIVAVGGDENPNEGEPFATTGRVLRSRDGGRTWAAASTTFFVSGNQNLRQRSERLAIDPANPAHVLFGTRRQGLWESTDGGATFRQVPTAQVPEGEPNRPDQDHAGVSFVSFDPSAPGRAYAGVAGSGVYRSDDGAKTWRRVVEVAAKVQVPFEGTVTDGRLLVSVTTIDGDERGHLRVYDPASGTSTDIEPGRSSAWSAAVDPRDPTHIVATDEAVRSGHLWRSRDAGKSWTAFDVAIDASSIPWLDNTDLAGYMSVGRLVFDPVKAGRVWFAEGMGVWYTDDLGADAAPSTVTWHLESRGIEEIVVADVITPPGAGGPITVAADRQGFRSTALDAYPTNPLVDRRFAGGTDLDYSGKHPETLVWIGAEYHIYWDDRRVARAAISTDSGATWKELPNLTKKMFGGNVAVSATDPNNIVWLPSYYINPFEYSDQGKGIFVTTNGGKSWQNKTVGGKSNFHRFLWWLGHQGLTADKVDGGVFYLHNDTSEFFVSTDGGVSWKKAANATPCAEFNACFVFGQIIASPSKAGEVWSSVGEGGLYRTTDRGATPWQKLPGVTEVRNFGFGAPLQAGGPEAVYVYGKANGDPTLGLWRSADAGLTWQLLGRLPYGIYAKVTAVNGDLDHPGRVYVGFGGTGVVYGEDPALR